MAVFTSDDALQMAMTIEKNGKAFYTALAAKATEPGIKSLFEELAAQEDRHYFTFEGMFGKAAGPIDAPIDEYDEYQVYMQGALDNALLSDPGKAIAAAEQAPDRQAVVQLAMGLEKDTLLFFYDLREMVGEAHRKTVNAIIQEEKTHLLRLAKGVTDQPIKNWWKCSLCGHTLQAPTPPELCPSCQRKCAFIDVTCYTPGCDPNQPDPQLLGPSRR